MPARSAVRIAQLAAPALTILLGCTSSGAVDAPPPVPIADATGDSLPSLPPSLLDAPITYDARAKGGQAWEPKNYDGKY